MELVAEKTVEAPVVVIPPVSPELELQKQAHKESEAAFSSASSRKINSIWEVTQSVVAVAITLATIVAAFRGLASETITNAFFLVIGFYFGRTNHTKSSGFPTQER